MAATLPNLGPHRTIVPLPDFDLDDLVPACEVLAQERFRVWSIGIGRLDDLPALLGLFGRRVLIGVSGLEEADQVRAVSAAGGAFATSDFLLPKLVDAAPELPVVLGGLTPSELLAGIRAGAAAVQLHPSEAYGTGMARALPSLLPPGRLIASGRMERYQAGIWLDAGAIGVCPTDLVSVDLIVAESLDGLRARLQSWASAD